MKRLISLMLALLMLCTVLASCSSDGDDKEGYTEGETVIGENGLAYDSNGFLLDDLGTMDFGGKEIIISGWKEIADRLPEYEVEGLDGEILSEATFKRNLAVEERMQVKLTYELLGGHTGGGAATKPQLDRIANAAGTNEINLIATYSWNPASLLVKGYLGDMAKMPYLNLEAPWWNQSILEKNSVYGKVYFATGDIAPSYIGVTYGMFFNKQLAAEYKVGDPYKFYDEGEWTLERMMTMAKKVGTDTDGMGTKNKGDIFGFVTSQTPTDAFLQGSGILTVENEADGALKIGSQFGSERAHELLVRLGDFAKTDGAFFDDGNGSFFEDAWMDGEALFILEEFDSVKDWVTEGMTDIGVLPMPKYDSSQQEYYTIPGFYHTVYCVPLTMVNDEATGATLECLASESYRNITPAYFENQFQTRYSDGTRERDMFAVIKDCVVIDAGRLFQSQLGSDTWQPYRNAMFSSSYTRWMSAYEGIEKTLQKRIDILNEYIAKLEA